MFLEKCKIFYNKRRNSTQIIFAEKEKVDSDNAEAMKQLDSGFFENPFHNYTSEVLLTLKVIIKSEWLHNNFLRFGKENDNHLQSRKSSSYTNFPATIIKVS